MMAHQHFFTESIISSPSAIRWRLIAIVRQLIQLITRRLKRCDNYHWMRLVKCTTGWQFKQWLQCLVTRWQLNFDWCNNKPVQLCQLSMNNPNIVAKLLNHVRSRSINNERSYEIQYNLKRNWIEKKARKSNRRKDGDKKEGERWISTVVASVFMDDVGQPKGRRHIDALAFIIVVFVHRTRSLLADGPRRFRIIQLRTANRWQIHSLISIISIPSFLPIASNDFHIWVYELTSFIYT